MKIGRGLVALAAVLAVTSAARAGEDAETFTITGTSSVRGWTCKVPSYDASIQVDPGFAPADAAPAGDVASAVLSGSEQVQDVEVVVPVASIDCGNGKMEEHLRKALKAEEDSTITYRLSSYDLTPAADGGTVTAAGTLTIAGETRPVDLTVSAAPASGGGLRVVGQQEIDMTEWGVKPPTLMFGTLKVGERVTVGFDITLHP